MSEPAPRSRYRPERGCRDKVRYPARRQAESAAEKQSRDFDAPIDHYHCPHCDGWHTGNVPRWLALDREFGVFAAEEASALSDDTVTIDGQVYDRQAILGWLRGESPYSVDLIPEDGLSIDRDAGTVAVKFLACDMNGDPIIDPVRICRMHTGWMEGRYSTEPPEPVGHDRAIEGRVEVNERAV